MALLGTQSIFVVNQNVNFNNSYIKITQFVGDKIASKIHVTAYVEKDGIVIRQSTYEFQPSLDLPLFNQAYLHLKTLPEFATATDC